MVTLSPTQKALALAAGIAVILWALWTALRAIHPHWRKGGWECYVRIGMIVFLAVVGLELIGVAEEWNFFTGNPRHFFLLPATTAAVLVLVVLPAIIMEKRRKRGQATQPRHFALTVSDEAIFRIAAAYLWLLLVLLSLMPLGLYGQLFGPPSTFFIGVMGFISAIAVFGLSRTSVGRHFRRVCPHGLSERFLALQRIKFPLRRALRVVAIIATVGLVTLVVTARLAGVPGTPVFAQRTHYFLVSHSVPTSVSRLRYCFAGTGFQVAWHFGAVYTLLLAMHGLIFGRVPSRKDL